MLRPLIFAFASTTWGAPELTSEERPVQLRWTAPDPCPPAEYVRERTETLLARSLDDPDHPEVEASVTVRGEAGRWSATLELSTRDGRRVRTLRARSCDALADASALLVAVTIDPTARTIVPGETPDGLPPAPSLPADRSPTSIPEAVPVEERELPVSPPLRGPAARTMAKPPQAPGRRPLGFVGATFALQGGGGPGLAVGAAASGGLGWRRARVLVAGSYAVSVRPREIAPGVGLSARQGWAMVAGCGLLARGRLEAPLCGGWFAGAVRAVARGLGDGRPVLLPWTGLVLAAGVRYVFHRNIAAAADVMALVPVVRPTFVVDGLGVVHQTASVAVSGHLGLELRFP